MVYLVYDPFTKNHKFLINNLRHNLNIFNHELNELDNVDDKNDINNMYIILINHMFLIENDKAKKDYKNLLKKKNKILYITEPIELMIEKKFYTKIINELKPLKVYTYCEENLTKIKPICKFINFYPINKTYFKFLEINGPMYKNKDLTKIVFIGKMNEYRNKLKEIFKDDLIIIEDKYNKEEWIEIIKKYQYFVNVHRRPNSKCFESMRILPLLFNNCTIISEHVNNKEESYFKEGNIYFCKLEKMKDKFDEIKNISFTNIITRAQNIEYYKYINMNVFFQN